MNTMVRKFRNENGDYTEVLTLVYKDTTTGLKYKTEFKVSKVKDYLLVHLQSSQEQSYQEAFQYVRSIVNTKQHGKNY